MQATIYVETPDDNFNRGKYFDITINESEPINMILLNTVTPLIDEKHLFKGFVEVTIAIDGAVMDKEAMSNGYINDFSPREQPAVLIVIKGTRSSRKVYF